MEKTASDGPGACVRGHQGLPVILLGLTSVSYKWAEVLDADAFAHFKENGIFDRETADAFRHNILEKGGSEAPDVIYKRFRGQDPTIDALLIRDGIKEPEAPASLLKKD